MSGCRFAGFRLGLLAWSSVFGNKSSFLPLSTTPPIPPQLPPSLYNSAPPPSTLKPRLNSQPSTLNLTPNTPSPSTNATPSTIPARSPLPCPLPPQAYPIHSVPPYLVVANEGEEPNCEKVQPLEHQCILHDVPAKRVQEFGVGIRV